MSVPVTRFEAWRRGNAALPHLRGQVFIILVAGPCYDRRPAAVDFIQLSRYAVTAEGTRSRGHISKELRGIWDGIDTTPIPHENVLDGRERFLAARNRAKWEWKPTDMDADAIRAAVNHKAKGHIL